MIMIMMGSRRCERMAARSRDGASLQEQGPVALLFAERFSAARITIINCE